MDRLPSELLHIIFTTLPILQKKECMLVCKQWARIIRTQSLFYAVTISHKQERFRKFIKMIERRPALGKQVKYLHLFSCIDGQYDQRMLLRVFHNLKVIKVTRHCLVESQKPSETSLDIQLSSSQLKHVEDSFKCEMIISLLKSKLCSRLVTLTLSHISKDIAHKDIYLLLKEAPLLKKLELSNANITLDDCETIHTNLPLLQSLKLPSCNFSRNSDSTTKTISSVSAMTTLYIVVAAFEQHDLIDWLWYISIKYSNLVDLNFSLDPRNHLVKHNNLKSLYEKGYHFVLQRLSSQLKSLEPINVEYHNEIFKKLDILGCQIKNTTLNELSDASSFALSESGQSKHIEMLSLNLSQSISFEWLKKMESLKSLNISFKDTETIHLNKLFQLFPNNIENLYISNFKINHVTNTDQQFPIKQLYLKTIDLSVSRRGLDKFITKCLPDLHKFRLTTSVDENTTLMFPNHHFSVLDLDFGPNVVDFTITTLNDKKTRFFSRRKNESCAYLSDLDGRLITPISKNDLASKILITVVCGSTKDLYLGASRAYF